jgi:hypothetical protein
VNGIADRTSFAGEGRCLLGGSPAGNCPCEVPLLSQEKGRTQLPQQMPVLYQYLISLSRIGQHGTNDEHCRETPQTEFDSV